MRTQRPRAAIYCRISSDPEGLAHGVERQEADCRALADGLGFEVTRVFTENDTGASTKSRKPRPLYRELLDGASSGRFDVILAYSNSRLTRRPAEWEELIRVVERTGLSIHTVVSGRADFSTADGRAVARTIAAWDAAEAERTAERVKRAKQDAVVRGEWRGGPRPFGYGPDGVTVDLQEAAALERAADAIIAGRTLAAAAREMREAGVTTTRGRKPMTPLALRDILLRPRNAGLLEVGEYTADGKRTGAKIVGHASWPAILPEDKWAAVRGILTDPARRTQSGSENKWLGSFLYRCGAEGCTETVRPSVATGRDRSRRRVYRCRSGRHVNRDLARTDAFVREVVAAYLRRPDIVAALPVDEPNRADLEAAKADLRALRERRAQLAADYALGLLDGTQVHAATVRLDAMIAEASKALESVGTNSVVASLAKAADPGQEFLDADVDRQRAIVAAIAEVVILPSPKGRPKGHVPGTPYWDPAFIRINWI